MPDGHPVAVDVAPWDGHNITSRIFHLGMHSLFYEAVHEETSDKPKIVSMQLLRGRDSSLQKSQQCKDKEVLRNTVKYLVQSVSNLFSNSWGDKVKRETETET